jgi:hypothetical protein
MYHSTLATLTHDFINFNNFISTKRILVLKIQFFPFTTFYSFGKENFNFFENNITSAEAAKVVLWYECKVMALY